MKLKFVFKGGEGSGNFGHSGRPGLVGGSDPDFDIHGNDRLIGPGKLAHTGYRLESQMAPGEFEAGLRADIAETAKLKDIASIRIALDTIKTADAVDGSKFVKMRDDLYEWNISSTAKITLALTTAHGTTTREVMADQNHQKITYAIEAVARYKYPDTGTWVRFNSHTFASYVASNQKARDRAYVAALKLKAMKKLEKLMK